MLFGRIGNHKMSEPQKNLWESAKTVIKGEIAPPLFKAFLSETEGALLKDNTLYVKSPNEYTRNLCNNGYAVISLNSVRSINKSITNVVFMVQSEIDQLLEAEKITEDVVEPVITNNLKTFETFVVGKNSQFAHAAASSVADAPSKSYNPLFIYGKSGVGKTHLMQAICARVASVHPTLKVLYVTSEEFTSDFVEAVRFNKDNNYQKKDNFKNKYRSVDMLLIDDIQFIAGKKETQEEFFNTFNTLLQKNKQIVVTLDRPPREVKTLDNRIRSRLESGLFADITTPDYETRVGIVQKKAEGMGIEISEDLIHYIAENIKVNIRQLEGVVKKLKAFITLQNRVPTISTVQGFIKDVINDTKPEPIKIEKIIEEVSKTYNVSEEEILSNKRTAPLVLARQVAMYISRKTTDLSFKQIGECFGKDHTTVLSNVNKVETFLIDKPYQKELVDDIIKNLKSNNTVSY